MTNYNKLLEDVFSKKKSKIFYNLKNMSKLAKYFKIFENSYKIIHIAGTNGKGSVATKLSNVLKISGYKVGLFTSPHIVDFRERFLINFKKISKKDTFELMREILKASNILNIEMSFFEISAILAFLYFERKKVDFAVIETGLGGRLDATNIIKNPILSIITSISLDHENILGNSLEKIAFEKSKIIKEDSAVLLGPTANFKCFEKEALLKNTKVIKVLKKFEFFDDENIEIAKTAVEYLFKSFKIAISEKVLKALLIRPRCRFEIFKKGTNTIILDVAHNVSALNNLYSKIIKKFKNQKIISVFGLCKDKNISEMLKIVEKFSTFTYLIQADNERACSIKILESFFASKSFKKFQNLEEILEAEKKTVIVITGSFFIIEKILKFSNFLSK